MGPTRAPFILSNLVLSTFITFSLIQNMDASNFTHIDSPETSDETEAMPGESIMDDISSVLGHDITYALQDNTLTDDTTTLCSEHAGPPKPPRKKSLSALSRTQAHPRRRNSSPPRIARLARMDSDDNPQQFGFENIVFEIDNRCDDQKMREPPRYCSLAQFVEGNDIARQSFKVGIADQVGLAVCLVCK